MYVHGSNFVNESTYTTCTLSPSLKCWKSRACINRIAIRVSRWDWFWMLCVLDTIPSPVASPAALNSFVYGTYVASCSCKFLWPCVRARAHVCLNISSLFFSLDDFLLRIIFNDISFEVNFYQFSKLGDVITFKNSISQGWLYHLKPYYFYEKWGSLIEKAIFEVDNGF